MQCIVKEWLGKSKSPSGYICYKIPELPAKIPELRQVSAHGFFGIFPKQNHRLYNSRQDLTPRNYYNPTLIKHKTPILSHRVL